MGRRSHSNCFSFMFQISDWIGDCISPQVRTFLEFFLLTSFVHLSIFFKGIRRVNNFGCVRSTSNHEAEGVEMKFNFGGEIV